MLGYLVDSFLFYTILLGLPLLILAYFYCWIKPSDKRKKHRKTLTIIAACVVLFFVLFDLFRNYHSVSGHLEERFNIQITALEHDSFLDWPVDFWITIDALPTQQSITFELNSGHGPYFEF